MRAVTATGPIWTQGQKAAITGQLTTSVLSEPAMTSPDRNQRLAAKLRENLKRRKAQSRARRSGEGIDEDAGTRDTKLSTDSGKAKRPASE